MKKAGQIILFAICFILVTFMGACADKTVSQREYENNMTDAEKSKMLVESSEEGAGISFYDEEMDASYKFDLLKSSAYDETKESALYVILGGSFNPTERKALFEYLGNTSPQTLVAMLSTDDIEDVKSESNRDYVEKVTDFQTFLTDNVLGWFCANYNIDSKQICITGYETAGFFEGYALYHGNPVENYLLISPEMFKKKENMDMEAMEAANSSKLSAKVCIVSAEEDSNSRAFTSTDKWLKALSNNSHPELTVNNLTLKGAGHNTMELEALLQGICYFNGAEYGAKEEACVAASKVLTKKEQDSIKVGSLSEEHEFYQEVVTADPAAKDYIREISIYDEEINDSFVIHLSLPEDYDPSKKYPLVLMTDGVWRLSDHPQLRQMMFKKEIEDVILVSIGYPNGYDYMSIRERDLVQQPDLYLQFLVENLTPYLCENYSIDKERVTLTGHSYGGYWALYALFHSDTIAKNTFSSYYIGSPSVQENTNLAFAAAFEKWYYERKQELNASVYVTVGGDEENGFKSMIKSFYDGMNAHTYQGLSMDYEVIEGYDHNTVFKPSIRNMMLRCYGTDK
jgi:hypothetical protein